MPEVVDEAVEKAVEGPAGASATSGGGAAGADAPAAGKRTLERMIYVGFAVVILGALALLGLNAKERHERRKAPAVSLKVFAEVPEFELQERGGATVTRETLLGSVWIADFIFTSCAGQCEGMSARMARLQHELPQRPDLRLVSITVDPENDTPEKLAAYAEKKQAVPGRWLFLTAKDYATIHRLSVQGFKMTTMPAPEPGAEIVHSPNLVLVDREGKIRGYYRYDDEDAMRALKRDAQALLR